MCHCALYIKLVARPTLFIISLIQIVDINSGEALGAHEHGEIWVRGPQVMKGYLNNPAATSSAITEDGWLKTGTCR